MKNIPQSLPAFLWIFIKLNKWAFFILMLTAIIWAINQAFFPYFIKIIINTLSQFEENKTSVYSILQKPFIALLSLWFIMECAMRLQGFLSIKVLPQFRAHIREAIFNYVKQHSHAYFADNFSGDIAKKLSDLPESCQTLIEIIIFNLASILPVFVIAVVLMWLTNIGFAIILLVWFTIHIGLMFLFIHKSNFLWEIHSEASTTLSGKIIDTLSNIANVRLFARGDYESKYLNQFQKDEIQKAKRAMRLMEIIKLCHGILAFMLIFSMLFALIYGWQKGWVTLGDFSLISMLSLSVLGLVWAMSYLITVFTREVGRAKNALTLMIKTHEVIDQPNAPALIVNQGNIFFSNVIFSYQKNKILFHKLNIKISAGQSVGLVGYSGSGKSTFVNLILRLYDVESGEILIDGQNIAKITQDSLHKNIAMIPQEPRLFHRTLRENIRYGRLEASNEEVIEAAEIAHCNEFITALPEGYNTLVGEYGIKLSGGQRQRIAIARAILKNAPILIFDEATSALDSVTEKYIQESLAKLMAGKTTIFIAHRLSTLINLDRILVFEHGNIVEDGTIKQLLTLNGHFAQLWKMQNFGRLPDIHLTD